MARLSGLNKIICGDAVEVLKTMPDECVHMACTSPPYWNLRDYGIEHQLGLEKTPEEYVARMVEIFREVRRVLRKDGVMFLNMGDCYTSGGRGTYATPEQLGDSLQTTSKAWLGAGASNTRRPTPSGLKPKDLIGMPWRVAFALQADGWWLRSDIIWAKPNPMPESVRDRPTKSHEYMFLLTKSAKYYYDQEAIREEIKPTTTGQCSVRPSGDSRTRDKNYWGIPHETKQVVRTYDRICGANARSVWTIATQPFPEAHFATFPEKLIEPCIKAGTSEKGCCPKCGAGWVRIVDKKLTNTEGWGKATKDHHLTPQSAIRDDGGRMGDSLTTTLGWRPSCGCDGNPEQIAWDVKMGLLEYEPIPAIVLDPFIGSGTTALVAKKLGRNFIGIELNPQYVEMANKRLADAMPFFNNARGE